MACPGKPPSSIDSAQQLVKVLISKTQCRSQRRLFWKVDRDRSKLIKLSRLWLWKAGPSQVNQCEDIRSKAKERPSEEVFSRSPARAAFLPCRNLILEKKTKSNARVITVSPASAKVSWKLLTSKGDLIGWPGNYFAWGFLFNQPYEIFFSLRLNLRLPWDACPHLSLLKGKPPKARNIPKLNSRQMCFNYLTEIHRRNNLISPLHGKECSYW